MELAAVYVWEVLSLWVEGVCYAPCSSVFHMNVLHHYYIIGCPKMRQ